MIRLRFLAISITTILLFAYAESGGQTVGEAEYIAAPFGEVETERAEEFIREKPKRELATLQVGVTGVVGGTGVRYTSGTVKGRRAMSFGGGLYGKINMGNIALRPEVIYERNGAKHPEGKIWTNSIVVPLDIMWQTKRSDQGLYANVGGYYRYTLSGEQGDTKINFTHNFYRNEAGVQWGLGFWIYKFTLGVNFRYGLTDMMRKEAVSNHPNMRLRTTQFKLSFRF